MLKEIPLISGFYIDESLPVSHQQCVNLYEQIPNEAALSTKQLVGTPGITQLITTNLTQDSNRGSVVKDDIYYFVNGNSFYKLIRTFGPYNSDVFSYSLIGTISGTGRVSIAHNPTQIAILVPGGDGYIYTPSTNVLVTISDSDFTASGNPQMIVFIDGYFACNTDTKKWILSALNDGTSWDALDFLSAESDPDTITAPIVTRNQIYLVGSETVEGFQNIGGDSYQPFLRNGVNIDKGSTAPFSIISAAGTFFMVGAGKRENVTILGFTGGDMSTVSTPVIDGVIQRYSSTDLAKSFGWSYSSKGATFVGFTFPEHTFVLNLSTGKWHERSSYTAEESRRWRVSSIEKAYERLIVGDLFDGRIGYLNEDAYTEYDEPIIRAFSSQPFTNSGEEVVSTILELTMESGIGNEDAPNPKVALSISKDGKTWGPPRLRAIGKVGEYSKRVIWRKNGRYTRFAVLKFEMSDPVKPVFIKLEYE